MLSKFLKNKKSKKGFTLVEALASVMILALIFVGILNAVAFARQMIFTDNARDKASEKAQLISDEIIATAVGHDPAVTGEDLNIVNEINQIANNTSDTQMTVIGEVTYMDLGFTDPAHFVKGADPEIQYTITPVSSSESDGADGTITYKDVRQAGWNVTVRVYYQRVNKNDAFDCIEVSAFAPHSYID